METDNDGHLVPRTFLLLGRHLPNVLYALKLFSDYMKEFLLFAPWLLNPLFQLVSKYQFSESLLLP